MAERQPDIEIYLKRPAFDDICRWLETHFKVNAIAPKGLGKMLDLSFHGETLQCLIIEKVVKGGYTSLWFRQNFTPWQNDIVCTEEAHKVLMLESRCAIDGWDTSKKEKGGWYRLLDGEKVIVNWLE